MSKRNNDVPGPSGQPPAKKLHFEPTVLGTISSLEEMEVKTLRFQNRKLAQVMYLYINLYSILVLVLLFNNMQLR